MPCVVYDLDAFYIASSAMCFNLNCSNQAWFREDGRLLCSSFIVSALCPCVMRKAPPHLQHVIARYKRISMKEGIKLRSKNMRYRFGGCGRVFQSNTLQRTRSQVLTYAHTCVFAANTSAFVRLTVACYPYARVEVMRNNRSTPSFTFRGRYFANTPTSLLKWPTLPVRCRTTKKAWKWLKWLPGKLKFSARRYAWNKCALIVLRGFYFLFAADYFITVGRAWVWLKP